MSILFISDLHLDESRPAVTRAFLDFLKQQAVHAHALYILGDFFEVWVGDDNHSALNKTIIDALKQLSHCDTAIYIMHGNRDFLLGKYFCQQSGCQLISDPTVIDLYGRLTLLMHGDSLCTSDSDYLKFRAQVRNPQWQEVLLAKSVQERIAIGKQLRTASMDANSNKADDILDVTASEVDLTMKQHNVDLLIHGHTHRPAIHNLDRGNTRIVLGDWDSQGWYLHACPEGKLELNNFIID